MTKCSVSSVPKACAQQYHTNCSRVSLAYYNSHVTTTVTKHPFLFLDVTNGNMEICLKRIDPCQLNSSQLKQPQTSHGVKSKVGHNAGHKNISQNELTRTELSP